VQLQQLIEGLLNYHRAQESVGRLELTAVRFDEVVEQVLDRFTGSRSWPAASAPTCGWTRSYFKRTRKNYAPSRRIWSRMRSNTHRMRV